jgi:hypothetical protein
MINPFSRLDMGWILTVLVIVVVSTGVGILIGLWMSG